MSKLTVLEICWVNLSGNGASTWAVVPGRVNFSKTQYKLPPKTMRPALKLTDSRPSQNIMRTTLAKRIPCFVQITAKLWKQASWAFSVFPTIYSAISRKVKHYKSSEVLNYLACSSVTLSHELGTNKTNSDVFFQQFRVKYAQNLKSENNNRMLYKVVPRYGR